MGTESSVNDPRSGPEQSRDLKIRSDRVGPISRNHDAFSDMYRVPMSGPASELDAVRARLHADEASAVLTQIAELLADGSSDGLAPDEICRGLAAREAVASTNIGSGIALPHFIDHNVRSPRLVAITLVSPIRWGSSPDGVDLVFGLSGTPAEPWRHVRSLARLARISSVPGFADLLRGAPDDGTLRRLFAEEAMRHG